MSSINMINGMNLSKIYEEKRDLCLSMAYKRGTTTVAERTYTYDALARPVTRSTAREELATVNDSFGYNNRSELVNATVNNGSYGYAYDNIGNRETASELTDTTAYATNALNQYTTITEGEEAPFAPTYDAAGNQTKIKTATGIWNVTYNAENRPVQFTSEDGNMVIDCAYDYMGRRVSKKRTVNGVVVEHLRFLYRGYLQIGAYNALNGNFQWFILWDPTESIATRPLAIRKDGAWYAYGIDLTKNVCELFDTVGTIATRYDYTPFGEVSATGDVTQPIQWSSEYSDTELGLVYYNYRHYNSKDGRWINRDPIAEKGGLNLYGVVGNGEVFRGDIFGLIDFSEGTADPIIVTDPGAGIWKSLSPKNHHNEYKQYFYTYYNIALTLYPNAAIHLKHYFDNTGTDLHILLDDMLKKVPSARKNYVKEAHEMMKFITLNYKKEGTYYITSKKGSPGYNLKEENKEWFYAVGGYQYWSKGIVHVKCENKKLKYTLEFEYKVFDRYNWDEGKGITFAFIPIEDAKMGEFHKVGIAKEFDMLGSQKASYEWYDENVVSLSSSTLAPKIVAASTNSRR